MSCQHHALGNCLGNLGTVAPPDASQRRRQRCVLARRSCQGGCSIAQIVSFGRVSNPYAHGNEHGLTARWHDERLANFSLETCGHQLRARQTELSGHRFV